MSHKSNKPSLADIISGKHDWKKESGKPNNEHIVHRLPASRSNGMNFYCPNAGSLGKNEDVLAPNLISDSDSVETQKFIQDGALIALGESCEINRENVLRVLDQMGIKNMLDISMLEPYFLNRDTGTPCHVMPRENRIALIKKLSGLQNKPKCDFSSTFDEKTNNRQVFFQSERESAMRTRSDSVSVNGSMSHGKDRWVTGTEEGDAMLIRLFVHCGAQSRTKASIELCLWDFRNMIDLRRETLPPPSILEHVAEKLNSPALMGSNERCVNLQQFYSIIQEEIHGIWTNYPARESVRSLPTLCMVLVALAPIPMEKICGTEVVEYLRSPKTVKYVLRMLSANEGRGLKKYQNMTFRESFARKLEDGYFKSTGQRFSAPSSPVPSPPLAPRCSSKTKAQSSTGMPIRRVPCSSLTVPTNGKLQHKSRSLSEASGSRGSSVPRYMEQRPIDEISASIIARSKARKLIDKLRQNTIPTNRTECFARIEYIQREMFKEANLSEDDDGDDEATSGACEGTSLKRSRLRQRPVFWKVRPIGVSGPLLPGMYKVGGLGQPLTRKAHQKTFERLYRSRLSFQGVYGSSLRSRGTSAPDLPSENNARSSSPHWGQGTELRKLPYNEEALMMGEYRSRRRSSHSSLMLADIFAKRFIQCGPGMDSSHGSQCKSSKGSSTIAMDAHLHERRHTRPPAPKRSNSTASDGNRASIKNRIRAALGR